MMEPTPMQRMIVVAKQQILLYKATHKDKPTVCQWCFEEPAMEGKTVCQGCIDAINKENEENKNFDIDKCLDETEEEMTERRFNNEHWANR